MNRGRFSVSKRVAMSVLFLAAVAIGSSLVVAHPLGNFTINHFNRIEVGRDIVKLHGVIDMAEIPTFQELQTIDTDGDGKASTAELNEYVNRSAVLWVDKLLLTIDGVRVPLTVDAKDASLPVGAGGLQTLRVEANSPRQAIPDRARCDSRMAIILIGLAGARLWLHQSPESQSLTARHSLMD